MRLPIYSRYLLSLALPSFALLPGAAADASSTKTVPVYVGTTLVTAVQCPGSTDTVGSVYATTYRDVTSAIDFALFQSGVGAKAFASTSGTQGRLVTLTASGTAATAVATYSNFTFNPLTSTDAVMTITISSSATCTESYRAVLTLTSVTS